MPLPLTPYPAFTETLSIAFLWRRPRWRAWRLLQLIRRWRGIRGQCAKYKPDFEALATLCPKSQRGLMAMDYSIIRVRGATQWTAVPIKPMWRCA